MNERDQAKLFNDLLEGRADSSQPLSPDMQASVDFARHLQRSSLSSLTGQREALRARLLQEFPTRSRWGMFRQGFSLAGRALAAVVLVVALVFLFDRQVHPLIPAHPTDIPPLSTAPAQATGTTDTLADIASQVAFTVFTPDTARLSFPLNFITADLSDNGDDGLSVVQTYGSDTGKLRIIQSALPGGPDPIAPPMKSTGEVSLRGRTGYWVVLNMGDTVLYWVEGFSQITLSGLSQDQLLEAAESLQPLTPALTISQAAAQVSFPILTIDAQNAPFPLEWQSARIYPDMDTPVVLQTFLRDGAEIRLQQRSLNGQALALPQVENVPVTVRGVQGYLVGRSSCIR
jgi:hypothetical protein